MSRNSKKRRRRKQDKVTALLIGTIVMLLCALVGINTWNLRQKSVELAQEEEKLKSDIEAAEKTSEELDAKESYMETDKYVEDVAKDKLGLVYPNEMIIEPDKKE